jgi:hypothetical protein
MSNSREVIADAIAEFMPEGDGGQDGYANLKRANEVTSALRGAGFAIVPRDVLGEPESDTWPEVG